MTQITEVAVLRYKVDLKAFMADCEANYYRLRKLLTGFEEEAGVAVALPGDGGDLMTIDIVERTPYTCLLDVRQAGVSALAPWLPHMHLRVRLYHDARLAEVVNCGGLRSPRPRYLYPNEGMLQPDEKAQWNRFLSEWLALAIRHGFAVAAPCEFVE